MSLYRAEKDNSINGERIRMMHSLFEKKNHISYFERTGNAVYDVASAYCAYLNVPITSLQSLIGTFGEDFDFQSVARLSGITCRQIELPEHWYRYRTMPFVAMSKDGKPLIFIPRGTSSTIAYDVQDGSTVKVTKEYAENIQKDAIIFYKPLPEGSLKIRDVLRYGMVFVSGMDLLVLFVMAFITTLVGLLLPVLNEMMFDKLIPMGSFSAIVQVGGVILVCSLGNMFFSLAKNLSSFRAISSAQYAIFNATIERLFLLPQQFIEKFGNVDLASRTMTIYTAFQGLSASLIAGIFGSLFSIIYLVRMFTKSSKLAFRALIMVLIAAIVVLIFARLRTRYEKKSIELGNTLSSRLFGFISGIAKVRLSAMEDTVLFRYQRTNVDLLSNGIKSARLLNISSVFSVAMSFVYTGVLYYVVMKKKLDISLGEFTSFTAAFGLFTSALVQITDFIASLPSLRSQFDRVRPIYEQSIESYSSNGIAVRYTGAIEVDNLKFAYDSSDHNVLKGISFKIEPGEYIGFAGSSGCGKTTLFRLLLGMLKPTVGNIYYDSRDINTINKRELRRQVGVVTQQNRLMTGSIYENVAMTANGISQARVKELLVEAGIGGDLERMPMGINTAVSEFGGTLSGGQRQRILIARALANDPKILFFDEATSALDNVSQMIVRTNLEKRHITRLVIAHRLSTLADCDRIYVMDDGRIIETGNYEELIANKGLFYNLVKQQLGGQEI